MALHSKCLHILDTIYQDKEKLFSLKLSIGKLFNRNALE